MSQGDQLESTNKEIFEKTGIYKGEFAVELTDDAVTKDFPNWEGVTVEGNKIHFAYAKVRQVMGGIQYSVEEGGEPIGFGYKFLKSIKDKDGSVIWENRNYRGDVVDVSGD